MKRRLLIAGLAAGIAATAGLFGGALAGGSGDQAAAPARTADTAQVLLQGFSAGDTAATIAGLEQRVGAAPEDAEGLVLLGFAYQQRARETGDPSFYPRSEEALDRSLELVPDNDLALTGLAALAATRHRFEESRRLAQRAVDLNPYSVEALGVLGDSLVELGRYEAAFATFDRMAATKPGLSSYARIAYARELKGKTDSAAEAMALAAALGSGERRERGVGSRRARQPQIQQRATAPRRARVRRGARPLSGLPPGPGRPRARGSRSRAYRRGGCALPGRPGGRASSRIRRPAR